MDAAIGNYAIDAATSDPATARPLRQGARCIVHLPCFLQSLILILPYSATDGCYVCHLAD